MTKKRARHLPHYDEHLLLRAAILEPPAAFEALQEFLRLYGHQSLTITSMTVTPSVYENLQKHPPAAAAIAPFQHPYRHSWIINQRNFHVAGAAIELLKSHGIDTLLLKGAAIVACGYRSNAARTMTDIDCLVPLQQAALAQQVLIDDGWDIRLAAGGDQHRVFQMVHGAAFSRRTGGAIDLHWHVLTDCLNEHDDDPFWEASVPIELEGIKSKSLHPSDMVLHALVHGARFNEPRIIAWVIDAHEIITKERDGFDWERLIAQTRRTSQMLQVQSCLEYLLEELGTPVPAWVLTSLSCEKVPFLDRLSYRDNDREDSTIALIRRDISGYLKRSRGRPLNERIRGTVWHLQVTREIDNPLTIPFKMAQRFYLRLRGHPPPVNEALRLQRTRKPPA